MLKDSEGSVIKIWTGAVVGSSANPQIVSQGYEVIIIL